MFLIEFSINVCNLFSTGNKIIVSTMFHKVDAFCYEEIFVYTVDNLLSGFKK